MTKFPKVPVEKKYGDYAFCSKKDCTIKTCCRHICHNSNPYWISVVDWWKRDKCHLKEGDRKC